jgi:hypothetical protein
MEYIKIYWIHDNENEPVILYSELDNERFEVRKVEIYKDGSMGWASSQAEFGGTALSPEPILDNIEIARDPYFLLSLVDRQEFEEVWEECAGE